MSWPGSRRMPEALAQLSLIGREALTDFLIAFPRNSILSHFEKGKR
jgi:hypothetical protein